ncbi:MAG: hypothetical protein SNH88_08065 [Rikenellaceae bacterium]
MSILRVIECSKSRDGVSILLPSPRSFAQVVQMVEWDYRELEVVVILCSEEQSLLEQIIEYYEMVQVSYCDPEELSGEHPCRLFRSRRRLFRRLVVVDGGEASLSRRLDMGLSIATYGYLLLVRDSLVAGGGFCSAILKQ